MAWTGYAMPLRHRLCLTDAGSITVVITEGQVGVPVMAKPEQG